MRAVAPVGPGCQAGQPGISQELPDSADLGVGLIVEEHLDRMRHQTTMARPGNETATPEPAMLAAQTMADRTPPFPLHCLSKREFALHEFR